MFEVGKDPGFSMAKTCFYCGKELAAGQRCSCRGTSATANSTASTSAATSEKAETSSAPKEENKQKAAKKEKVSKARPVRNSSGRKFSFASFIDQVRTSFPSLSKIMKPVMSYIWHPVSTIQNRSQRVSIPKVLIINSIFAAFTSLMVLYTNSTNSPFLGMLISLIFGKTDMFSEHPFIAFFTISAILWFCVLLLALCFFVMSRFANRKLPYLRALDTVTMSSIYICFADVLIFFSVLLGTQGAFTLIFVALVIMGITHYVSLKQDLALTDNACFNMLAVSYLLFYLFAQLGVAIIIRIANCF